MVVSVGPYMFHTAPALSTSWRARSRGMASPPQSTRSFERFQPAWNSSRQVVGVACMTVAFEASRRSRSARPSLTSSRVATTRRAPTISGRNTSSTEMSKAMVVTASSESLWVSPGSAAMLVKKFTTAPCWTCTPLGLPVEPLV
jgi:hypothetical protein